MQGSILDETFPPPHADNIFIWPEAKGFKLTGPVVFFGIIRAKQFAQLQLPKFASKKKIMYF